MPDSEDANSRRAARPSTPPFRGPAGPGARPPLTPPSPGSSKVPGPTSGQPASRTPVAPFVVPPAGARGRPATPSRNAGNPISTPPKGTPGPRAATPAGEARIRPDTSTRPRAVDDSEAAAIPAYGSAPPASVAATLKSISEFTIVEEPQETAETPAGITLYEPPAVTSRSSETPLHSSLSDDYLAAIPGTDALRVPATAPDSAAEAPGDRELDSAEPKADEPRYDGPAAELDTTLAAPPSEADHLFDSPEYADGVGASHARVREAETNDDVIASAFGATGSEGPHPYDRDESGAGDPVFIGGDPSTRFVAENLEEMARGIRAGEIVLPAIDPSADPPAVLAAVLAAILAPRR